MRGFAEKRKRKQQGSILSAAVIGFAYAGLTLAAWFSPEKEFSDSERRKLAQLPELSCAAISDGSFMKDFENWHGLECIECGSCSYVCPSRRQVAQSVKTMKKLVLAEKRKQK